MNHKLVLAALTPMTMASGTCHAAPSNIDRIDGGPQQAAETKENRVMDAQLPINKRFRTLEEYLAWLAKTQAPIDKPWYREIEPGVYELVTGGNLRILGVGGEEQPAKQRIFSRQELERKFGFSE